MTDQNKSTDERNALITAVLGKRCEPPHPRCMTCVAWAMSDELERLERALAETHDAWTAETTKRLQAVHERDCAVEDVKRLSEQFQQVADVLEKDGRFPTTVKAIRATVDVSGGA